jgi:hypothetical protein
MENFGIYGGNTVLLGPVSVKLEHAEHLDRLQIEAFNIIGVRLSRPTTRE